MRVLLFGNAEASILTLRGLLERGYEILAVAPPGGRGHYWHDSLMDECETLGVECYDLEDPNSPESINLFSKFFPDIIISTLYTEILSEEVISLANQAVNFHPSLLPSYRGTAPLIWAIVEGESETGVTAHRMEKKVDCGQIFGRRFFPIDSGDTGYDLHKKAASEISKLAMEVLELFELGRLLPIEPLDRIESLYSSKSKRVNLLDPSSQTVRKIEDIVRALAPPLPCAWLETDKGKLVVKSVLPVSEPDSINISNMADGINPFLFGGSRYIIASDGVLKIVDSELQ